MTAKPTYEALEQKIKKLEQARSERKLIEDTLRKSEEKYSRLFHSSNDAIFIHDLEGNIIDANQRVRELFGYTKEEIFTIKIPMLHPDKALERSKWAFETIIRDGVVSFEIDFKKKNGDLFSAEVSSSLFETGGDKVIQGIVRDISKRKRAEAALRESEEKYKLLAENSADLIYKIDIETGQCTYASPSAEKVIGYTADESLSLRVEDILTSESYTKQQERMLQGIQNGQTSSEMMELEAIHKDGHILPIEINANFINDGLGNPVEILGVARDITERKMAERALQEALKEIKDLRGILPLCSFCKRVRDDQGYWEQVDVYILKHSLADISHSICPECAKEHYPHFDISGDQ